MSYEELVNRYKDLFTSDFTKAWNEAARIATRRHDGRSRAGDRERELELREALQAQLDHYPCKCDCFDDFLCDCRRCNRAAANSRALAEFASTPRTSSRPPRAKPSKEATAHQRVASARSHAALAKQIYLAVQLNGRALNTWLVNDSDQDFQYTVRTGEYADGINSSIAARPPTALPARTTVLFEEDDEYGLDSVVWWDIDFTGSRGVVRQMHATRGKYGWADASEYVPVPRTDARGKILRLRRRISGDTTVA